MALRVLNLEMDQQYLQFQNYLLVQKMTQAAFACDQFGSLSSGYSNKSCNHKLVKKCVKNQCQILKFNNAYPYHYTMLKINTLKIPNDGHSR